MNSNRRHGSLTLNHCIVVPGIGDRRIVTEAAKGTKDLCNTLQFNGK